MFEQWEIEERVLAEADYVIEHAATVRQTAREFGISKSTVHKDLTQRIWNLDKRLYSRVREISDFNLSQRAIRGGLATKNRWKGHKKQSKRQ